MKNKGIFFKMMSFSVALFVMLQISFFSNFNNVNAEDRNSAFAVESSKVYDKYTTTTKIVDSGITWLKETSAGESLWYGIENSNLFDIGSTFWVKLLSKEEDEVEWNKVYDNMDELHRKAVDKNRMQLFNIGVTRPDGTEYTDFGEKTVKVYIQIPDSWDVSDFRAIFISKDKDTVLECTIEDSVTYTDDENGGSREGRFGVVTFKHFSPYAIFDKNDVDERIIYGIVGFLSALLLVSCVSLYVINLRKKKDVI